MSVSILTDWPLNNKGLVNLILFFNGFVPRTKIVFAILSDWLKKGYCESACDAFFTLSPANNRHKVLMASNQGCHTAKWASLLFFQASLFLQENFKRIIIWLEGFLKAVFREKTALWFIRFRKSFFGKYFQLTRHLKEIRGRTCWIYHTLYCIPRPEKSFPSWEIGSHKVKYRCRFTAKKQVWTDLCQVCSFMALMSSLHWFIRTEEKEGYLEMCGARAPKDSWLTLPTEITQENYLFSTVENETARWRFYF